MADCCDGFTRSRMLKAAAAQAGRGLPAIEPGMPLPAGTGMDRRQFVLRASGLMLSVYGAASLGWRSLEEGVAAAADEPPGPILVSIFMPGGWDSLSLLAPVGDAGYRKLRPTLGLAAGDGPAFSEDARLMWHPAAASLATLHAEGKVTVLPAVGYDHPDQSHFTSRHYWEVGELDPNNRLGWAGRYLDAKGVRDNPVAGLSLDSSLSPMLATAAAPVSAVESPEAYDFSSPGVEGPAFDDMMRAYKDLAAVPTAPAEPFLAGARAVQSSSALLRERLLPLRSPDGQPNYNSPVAYPAESDFGRRLQSLAAMIAIGLPLNIVTLEGGTDGFDTHSDQKATLDPQIKDTTDCVLAFQRDLEARGLADRVIVQIWSEFGRRAEENGSGTDHGAAGVAFIVGTRAAGTMVGEFPGLADGNGLDDDGNLRATSDFRAVYCSLLEQWLATDAAQIIPGAGSLPRPALIR
jgi:uncharacterized protein (DUF1501 family)